MSAGAETSRAASYVVVVEHNLVSKVARAADDSSAQVSGSPLETGTRLAESFRASGTIDGLYYFEDLPHARVFATLCLEFTRALADRRLATLKTLAAGAEFDAASGSSAQSLPGGAR